MSRPKSFPCSGDEAAWKAGEPPFTSPQVAMDEDDVDRCDSCNKILTTRDLMMRICQVCFDGRFDVGASQ